MSAELESLRFPELNDEAVLALEHFLEDFYNSFQNHYFAQLHCHDYPNTPQRDPFNNQLSLPLDEDPPF